MKVSEQYPGVKLGFSTQNFLASMPLGTDNLIEIIDYAATEGYSFIELRDPSAELSTEDCRLIAAHAAVRNIEVIYEIHKDLINPDFMEVFKRAVANTAQFGEPGILRSRLSWSKFASDDGKTGWTKEELDFMTALADSCANLAKTQDVKFIFENTIEPWFGNDGGYGLEDFFEATSVVGLQFDAANPFLPSYRGIAEPDRIASCLDTNATRWFTTHLKCGKDGVFQPVLADNPLSYVKIFELMSKHGIPYAALELLGVENQQACFDNHTASIGYLRELGIVE